MKGIILAGGFGTRLYPITKSVSKQLLCVYDKPMIYYPVSTLLSAGIKDILIISTPNDLKNYIKLLGDGSQLGIEISYLAQKKPYGLAHAFIIAEDFIGSESVCLILGDNIFHGNAFDNIFAKSIKNVKQSKSATIFGYFVNNPNRYGVLEFDDNNNVISIEEKPLIPKSSYAVVGLYIYPNSVIDIAKTISPSNRGELEITEVNNAFLKNKELNVKLFKRGLTWLDTGTPDSLLEASNFIQTIEKRQGLKVACLEEISYNKGYISYEKLQLLSKSLPNCEYGQYLSKILKNAVI
ncbi:glucose-1-phosphate thymidylyltransferase RfbA [Flavobacteriaceae bacterium]|nr:glucose-1-phosphate thymidylyltransferase RfbA [Flavobacteriaceae bacterium]